MHFAVLLNQLISMKHWITSDILFTTTVERCYCEQPASKSMIHAHLTSFYRSSTNKNLFFLKGADWLEQIIPDLMSPVIQNSMTVYLLFAVNKVYLWWAQLRLCFQLVLELNLNQQPAQHVHAALMGKLCFVEF